MNEQEHAAHDECDVARNAYIKANSDNLASALASTVGGEKVFNAGFNAAMASNTVCNLRADRDIFKEQARAAGEELKKERDYSTDLREAFLRESKKRKRMKRMLLDTLKQYHVDYEESRFSKMVELVGEACDGRNRLIDSIDRMSSAMSSGFAIRDKALFDVMDICQLMVGDGSKVSNPTASDVVKAVSNMANDLVALRAKLAKYESVSTP